MTPDDIVYLGQRVTGYGLGVLVFIWTRWIVIRAWKKR